MFLRRWTLQLAQLGVPLGQGYLLGRPASVEAWRSVPVRTRVSTSERRRVGAPAGLSGMGG